MNRKGCDGRNLKQSTNGVYRKVVLSKDAKLKNAYIHRMVLEAFRGPCPNGLVACHNDGDVNNNRLENLRWDTVSNNAMDKMRHGTMMIGSSHTNSKLSEEDIPFIRNCIDAGLYMYEIGNMFGVCKQTIHQIKHGKIWKHVNGR
jgi:hypothetical protein